LCIPSKDNVSENPGFESLGLLFSNKKKTTDADAIIDE